MLVFGSGGDYDDITYCEVTKKFVEDSENVYNIKVKIISKSLSIITHYLMLSEYLGPTRHLPAKPAHDINLPSIMSYI